MKTIELYLDKDFKSVLQDWSEVPVFKTLEVEDDVDLWGKAIEIDGEFYSVGRRQWEKHKIYKLDYLKLDAIEEEIETFLEDEITCPVCGYKSGDSWEIQEDSGEDYCDGCGASIEWGRDISVTYSASVKEVVKPIKLD